MIVSTMNIKEVKHEFLKDYPNVVEHLYNKTNDYRRRVLKKTIFPYNRESEIITKRKNRWLIYQQSDNRKEFHFKEKSKFICVAEDKGLTAFEMYSYDDFFVMKYIPHFFRRYRERLNMSEKDLDLIRTYFRRNKTYLMASDKLLLSGNTKAEIALFVNDGVALGNLENGFVTFKTFISTKTFNKTHKELYNYLYTEGENWLSVRDVVENLKTWLGD